ncbi:spoIIIJ-associated protein [Acetivibrio thermocellus AD2]|jgi:spoIIIJ-associated protein|uniref:RNA-binding protein KhpB n=1 Tax=Acetivibrio thermocellus AD2 TaxID=1138384 RepID=A0AB36TL63_ACETH|nr:RNA-binding cell elongation regulator Jag/EloR [Acetivibrio thermocellus]ADU76007.1 single-stranded nucleic acid binding R3H domain-containing protein [Acetivibrio thermocellus DSM 1313]ALX10042.1 single-stranded nucleic acid binding R3H domain-containing protein [Acetivibrio thermocellus AD2]ANV77816.1 single-stranded nucleic acid binding R3H domain-containing protein [Acetivibrio thermocellus DSM 2360]EIC04072.1 single-stranded nucleic acid binding R3H domain-containing protein [Acetivibri
MPRFVEKSAKTVREAIDLALLELNTTEDKVEVEVLEEGSKGIFGLIGSKQAKVRVTLKETSGDRAKKFLLDVLSKMKVNADILVEESEDTISLKIEGDDIGIIIGRRGETLDALQYLTSLVVNRSKEGYKRIVIDVENYRKKREETLIRLANRLADRVIKYKKNITLEPMNPYERRVIHSCLQNHKYVETYSVGEEPNRKVIIALK